jgi:hypothetical protein
MYLWDLVGHDTSEGVIRAGIDDDLAAVMDTAGLSLRQGHGFVVRIVEVVCRLSVLELDAVYVPTGRQWTGRRTTSGGVHWDHTFSPADPDVAYSLAGRRPLGAALRPVGPGPARFFAWRAKYRASAFLCRHLIPGRQLMITSVRGWLSSGMACSSGSVAALGF